AVGKPEGRKLIPALLADPDEEVRFLAAKWISDDKLVEHRGLLAEAIKDPKLTPRMYAAYATALARVDGRAVDEGMMADFCLSRVTEMASPPNARLLALRQVPASHLRLTLAVVKKLLEQADAGLQLEAARALCDHFDPKRFDLLLETARDAKLGADVRAQ